MKNKNFNRTIYRCLGLIQAVIFAMICASLSLAWESVNLNRSEQVETGYEVSQEIFRCLEDGWRCTVDGVEVGGVQEEYKGLLKYYIMMFYRVTFDEQEKTIIITSD